MISDTSPRPDLVDRGVFVPGTGDKPRPPKPEFAWLTGDDLKAPAARVTVTMFDVKGRDTEDADAAVARAVGDRYYVRAGSSGPVKGHLVDPRGVFYRADDLGRSEKTTGRPRYEFRQVPFEVFSDYVDYLGNSNTTLLRRAERVMNDA